MKRKKARGRQAGGQGGGAKRKKTGSRQSRGVRTTSGNLNVVLLVVTLITGTVIGALAVCLCAVVIAHVRRGDLGVAERINLDCQCFGQSSKY